MLEKALILGSLCEWGMGSRESGVGSRESGIRNRESGVGSRESGVGSREGERGNEESGIGDYLSSHTSHTPHPSPFFVRYIKYSLQTDLAKLPTSSNNKSEGS